MHKQNTKENHDPCRIYIRLAPSLPLNCFETGLFRSETIKRQPCSKFRSIYM